MHAILNSIVAIFALFSSASANEALCIDPVGVCSARLSSECVARVGAGLVGAAPAPGDCSEEFVAYRSCVAETRNCAAQEAIETADAPVVDPALVGAWQMLVPSSTGGLASWKLEIQPDGAYLFASQDPALKSAVGLLRAAAGKWAIQTKDWEDGGTYRMPSEDTVVFVGKTGAQMWTRSEKRE